MTLDEAMTIMYDEHKQSFDSEWWDAFRTIQKYLLVLRTLKTNLWIYKNTDECLRVYIELSNKEEIERIKEWIKE